MEKIIKVGGVEFPAKSTAASLFSYKANFGRDAVKDIIKLSKSMPPQIPQQADDSSEKMAKNLEIGDDFEVDLFYRFLWVFAKAARPDIPPLIEWLEEFDIPPLDFLTEAFPQVQDMLVSTVGSSVKPKN